MSNNGERLQLGRGRGPGGPRYRGDPDQPFVKRMLQRYRARRQRKKARVAAMSRGRRYARRGMIAGTWLLGFIAAGMVAVIVMYYAFTDVPRPEDLPLLQVTTIEYANGSTLARIGSEDRTIVHLADVPKPVQWAILAAEDRNFYNEPGVSIRGTVRAALNDLTGGDTQGGSGITQQYVRNAYPQVGTDRTLTRKLKELMIAVKLSREYSKDQILEFYLNTVYFGRGTYGIQAAAHAYFDEDVDHLTTAQGALLAGLLRAPSYYDPANNPGAARARWLYVLDGMVETGHLTEAQKAAMSFPRTKAPGGTGLGTNGWRQLIVNAVLAELDAHGISREELDARGLTIRTTIDKKAQKAAVSAIKHTFAHLTKKQRNLKNALVALDPTDGAVLAYYGGSGPGRKGYDGTVDYNDYAGQGGRPPGSSFKPYTLATVLTQTVEHTKHKPRLAIDSYVPGPYCKKIGGTKICNDPGDESVSSDSIKLSLAMKYSLNTTFDYLAFKAGPDEVAATAHKMGIAERNSRGEKTLVNKNGHTSFGIGIGDYPVTPLDQATGFATLANRGEQNDPFLVQRATDPNGRVVYRHQDHPQRALDKRVANDVTLTLEPVAEWSGDPLADGRVSAAKTGTEGVAPNSPNNSDAWMVGYTPQVSAAVWVGTGFNKPIYDANGQPLYGANLPGQTWKLFMDTYLAGKPKMQMATKQLIDASGNIPTATPTFTPVTSAPAPSNSPKPTFSIVTGFPTPTPTKTKPNPKPSTSIVTTTVSPSPSPSPTTSTTSKHGKP